MPQKYVIFAKNLSWWELYFTLNTVFLPQIREFNIYLPFEYHNFFAFMAKGDNFALVQSGFNV